MAGMKNFKIVLLIGAVLAVAVLASGCTTPFCTPQWEKQPLFVLDDAEGWKNCRNYCSEKLGTKGVKIEKDGLGYACYCDVNRCTV